MAIQYWELQINSGGAMGKPLLTDEIIERANRGEDISGPTLVDDQENKRYYLLHLNIIELHVQVTMVLVKIP